LMSLAQQERPATVTPVSDRTRGRIQKIIRRADVCSTRSRARGGGESRATREDEVDASGWKAASGRKSSSRSPKQGRVVRHNHRVSNRSSPGSPGSTASLAPGSLGGCESDVRRRRSSKGRGLERLEMPPRVGVSGLASAGSDKFLGGGKQREGESVAAARRGFRRLSRRIRLKPKRPRKAATNKCDRAGFRSAPSTKAAMRLTALGFGSEFNACAYPQ